MKSLVILFVFLSILGCEEKSITDTITPESPAAVDVEQGMLVIENQSDSMARGNLEYISQEKGKIAVDPSYYNEHTMNRGDVIYFRTPAIDKNKYPQLNPPEYTISRVIALPGEEIKIRKGQVYMNEKKLDTFYGRALVWGLGEKEYMKSLNSPGSGICDEPCLKTMKDYFNTDMAKVKVPTGHLFVMGDTWLRSIDSQIYGSIPVDTIVGKVLGYAHHAHGIRNNSR